MEKTEKTIQIIKAIGEQWPFLITVFAIFVIILKWKTIWSSLGKVKNIKLKQGSTELQVETETQFENKTKVPITESTSKPDDIIDESAEKVSTLFDCYLNIKNGKTEEANEVYKQIQDKADESDKFLNELVYTYYKFLHGFTDSIETLTDYYNEETLSSTNRHHVCYYLGLCYERSENREIALKFYKEAKELAPDSKEKTSCSINIANLHAENEMYEEAISELITTSKNIDEPRNLSNLYNSISKTYKKSGNVKLRIAFLEKAIEVLPNDTSKMFDLAYDYSDSDYNDASILRYINLLNFEPKNSMALNNLGYSFSLKNMDFKTVEYYKQAIENNNTLSVGNLSFKLLNAGFYDEAKKLIDAHKDEEDIDQMVIRAENELFDKKKKEAKELEESQKEGRKVSDFFKLYSNTMLSLESLNNYESKDWFDEDGNQISVTISNSNLLIKWSKPNKHLEDDDQFEIKGNVNIQGINIVYTYPRTITPGLLSSIRYEGKSEPFRSISNYSGMCAIDLKEGLIRIMYKVDKIEEFKTIKLKPSA